MVAATNYVGAVNGELVAHIAFAPRPGIKEARACRMVIMPEWQGAGIGMRFLNALCETWLRGDNRYHRPLRSLFHTSHPGLCAALRRDPKWRQISMIMGNASNKGESKASIIKSGGASAGYGGHLRAVQGFRYYGQAGIDARKGAA
jgi:hypothetical protein